jgi:FixJ family two-component response regulator
MEFDQSEASTEERMLSAMRLVSTLDAAELSVVICLGKGMSKKAIASASNLSLDDFESDLASLMEKLGARSIADLVRTAVYAKLSSHH